MKTLQDIKNAILEYKISLYVEMDGDTDIIHMDVTDEIENKIEVLNEICDLLTEIM